VSAVATTTPADALAAKIGLHTALGDEELAALRTLLTRPFSVAAGESLAAAGDPLDVCTIVIEGLICRTKALPDGRRQILSLLVPGDLVDAEAIVLRRRDDELEAVSASTVAVVPQQRLAAVGQQHPRLREAFLREALIEAAIAREWVRNIGRRNAKEALAHLLCELHQRLDGVGRVFDGRFQFPLQQQQLADALGLSTVHLNRVFRELRGEGLIALERRWLTLTDIAALRRLAHFDPSYLHFARSEAA
jgi:CRP-like cAMP-binding protein